MYCQNKSSTFVQARVYGLWVVYCNQQIQTINTFLLVSHVFLTKPVWLIREITVAGSQFDSKMEIRTKQLHLGSITWKLRIACLPTS